ncbi:type II toxin-antitoxin system HicB family antitoxin [Oceanicella sp. SM1341]|uniref:type II toxin-antitoxin system HicB family antitoxin n=1 Tax=Oceanicella sp. SM1341 TaxID=1548889 RepID=UPI000E4E4749|nr:type II toxin-antitoxin system HicB family antitoxin [Oceanicella sp. SM1341]
MLTYPVELTPDDNDTFLVTCPDLPEVTTFGEGQEEAIAHAAGAVAEALAGRLKRFSEIPMPSAGETQVAVDLLTEMKVRLMWAAQGAGMSRADLMRALGWQRNQVDRLFDANHHTRLDQFEAAFHALGVELQIGALQRAA